MGGQPGADELVMDQGGRLHAGRLTEGDELGAEGGPKSHDSMFARETAAPHVLSLDGRVMEGHLVHWATVTRPRERVYLRRVDVAVPS